MARSIADPSLLREQASLLRPSQDNEEAVMLTVADEASIALRNGSSSGAEAYLDVVQDVISEVVVEEKMMDVGEKKGILFVFKQRHGHLT